MTSPGGAPAPGRYRFDDIVVDQAAHTLLRAGAPQAIEPKAFAVLLALLRHPGELVARDDLLDEVWGHRHVTPGVLTRAIAQLRAALGDDPQRPRYIQTRHALGYSFVGSLRGEDELPGAGGQPDGTGAAADEARENAGRGIAPPARTPARPSGHRRARNAHTARLYGIAGGAALLAVVAALPFAQRGLTPPRAAEPSIAVLPFASLSDDRGDRYFAEGLSVEMHDALAGVQGLKVAARISPEHAAQMPDVKALGRRLGVATVLDASVRREGDRIRINARLSDTATGLTLWSRRYERELAGVFALQSEIAGEVVGSLMEVLPGTRQALARRLTPTRNVAAFDAYLRGLDQLLRPDGQAEAIGFFNQALAADRDLARAQAGICQSEAAMFETRRDRGAYERAVAACARAAAMDPGMSEVQLALAGLHYVRGEVGEAIRYYVKALGDPASRPAAYVGMAMIYGDQGKRAQSLDHFRRALALRPGDATIHSLGGYYSYLAGDTTAAIASYRRAIELKPGNAELWNMLGMMLLIAGDNEASVRAFRRSIAIAPNYAALSNLGELAYQSGDYDIAAGLHRRAIALEPDDFLPWGNLGDALRPLPENAPRARDAYREAATRAQRYVEIKSDDAKALAALGWYQANLGQAQAARELLHRSEALGSEPAEVALLNAQTLTVLGDRDGARRRVNAARAAGVPDIRISTNPVLRAAGIALPAAAPERKDASGADDGKGHTSRNPIWRPSANTKRKRRLARRRASGSAAGKWRNASS